MNISDAKLVSIIVFSFLSLTILLPVNAFSQDADDAIEEVVTISSRLPINLSEVVGSVNTISQEEIESRSVTDLNQLMENTIGVNVPRAAGGSTSRSYNEGVTIRGIGDSRVNILVDGVRVADAYLSGGFGKDLIDTELLKRVEILKGPSSALYGSDGLAGTVFYTTKDASDLASIGDAYLSTRFSYGAVNEMRAISLLGAVVGENSEALLQVTSRSMEEMSVHEDTSALPNPLDGDNISALAKVKYFINDTSDLSLTMDIQEMDADYNLLTDIGFNGRAMETISASNGIDSTTRERFSLAYNFSDQTALYDSGSIKIFSQDTDQKQITSRTKAAFLAGMAMPPTPMSDYRDYNFNQSLVGYSLDLIKVIDTSIGEHSIAYGGDYEIAEYSRPKNRFTTNLATREVSYTFAGPEVFPNKAFPDSEVTRTAIYFNDRIKLSDRMTLVVGARYDRYDQKASPDELSQRGNAGGHAFVPNDDEGMSAKIGTIFNFNDDISGFIQYAEGFRNPNFDEAYNTYSNFTQGYTIKPNPNLNPESSKGYELGFRGNHEVTNWSLVFFKNDYEDFIENSFASMGVVGTNPVMIFQYQNLKNVETDGIEFEIQRDFSDNFSASFGISSSDGREGDKDLLKMSPDNGKLRLSWASDNEKLKINLISHFVKKGPQGLAPSCGRGGCTNLIEVPGRVTHDLFLNYDVSEKFNYRFSLRNITDVKYWNWESIAGMSVGTADRFLNPDKNFSVSFGLKF